MGFITMMFAVGTLILGVYYASSSLTAQVITGEHAAILACACFLFVIALGVWRDAEDKINKRTNTLLEELIRRTPKPAPPREDYSQQDQYQRP